MSSSSAKMYETWDAERWYLVICNNPVEAENPVFLRNIKSYTDYRQVAPDRFIISTYLPIEILVERFNSGNISNCTVELAEFSYIHIPNLKKLKAARFGAFIINQ